MSDGRWRADGPLAGAASALGFPAAGGPPPWVLGLLAVIVVLLCAVSYWWGGRTGAHQVRLFAALADGQQRAGGGSLDASVQAVIAAAFRELRACEVEMVVLGADGPVHYVDDGVGVSRRRVDCNAFDSPWALRAMGARDVRGGDDDGRPQCSAVIGSFAELRGPLAVLRVQRPTGAPRFSRRELALVRQLVAQAERWLSPGTPESLAGAFGARGAVEVAGAVATSAGPGQDLTLLRDSARRLSSLASGAPGPDAVGQIVEELHAVERAVASLLGSVARSTAQTLAARGEELHVDRVGGRAAEEWTTTGVRASLLDA